MDWYIQIIKRNSDLSKRFYNICRDNVPNQLTNKLLSLTDSWTSNYYMLKRAMELLPALLLLQPIIPQYDKSLSELDYKIIEAIDWDTLKIVKNIYKAFSRYRKIMNRSPPTSLGFSISMANSLIKYCEDLMLITETKENVNDGLKIVLEILNKNHSVESLMSFSALLMDPRIKQKHFKSLSQWEIQSSIEK